MAAKEWFKGIAKNTQAYSVLKAFTIHSKHMGYLDIKAGDIVWAEPHMRNAERTLTTATMPNGEDYGKKSLIMSYLKPVSTTLRPDKSGAVVKHAPQLKGGVIAKDSNKALVLAPYTAINTNAMRGQMARMPLNNLAIIDNSRVINLKSAVRSDLPDVDCYKIIGWLYVGGQYANSGSYSAGDGNYYIEKGTFNLVDAATENKYSKYLSAEGETLKVNPIMKDIANDSFSDIGTPVAKDAPVLELKVTESVTPFWAKALPLIGLVAGGYYAYKQKGNIGQMILYAGIGGWVASAPSVYYGVEGIKKSVANSQVNKKA